MFRKVSLLILTGTLCLIAGLFDRRVVADDCPNTEPDTGIYCPAQNGDDPTYTCDTYTTQVVCDQSRHSKLFNPNKSAMKYSAGNLSMPVVQFGIPPILETAPCYTREICKWDDANGKCVVGKTETVWQLVYTKVSCPK